MQTKVVTKVRVCGRARERDERERDETSALLSILTQTRCPACPAPHRPLFLQVNAAFIIFEVVNGWWVRKKMRERQEGNVQGTKALSLMMRMSLRKKLALMKKGGEL